MELDKEKKKEKNKDQEKTNIAHTQEDVKK